LTVETPFGERVYRAASISADSCCIFVCPIVQVVIYDLFFTECALQHHSLPVFLRLLTFNLKLCGFAIATGKNEVVKLMKKHKRFQVAFAGADWWRLWRAEGQNRASAGDRELSAVFCKLFVLESRGQGWRYPRLQRLQKFGSGGQDAVV
jgi:hypothetical protein